MNRKLSHGSAQDGMAGQGNAFNRENGLIMEEGLANSKQSPFTYSELSADMRSQDDEKLNCDEFSASSISA